MLHTHIYLPVSAHLPAQELCGLQLKQQQPEIRASLCYAENALGSHWNTTTLASHRSSPCGCSYPPMCAIHIEIQLFDVEKSSESFCKTVKIWLKLLCGFSYTENICKIMQKTLQRRLELFFILVGEWSLLDDCCCFWQMSINDTRQTSYLSFGIIQYHSV